MATVVLKGLIVFE